MYITVSLQDGTKLAIPAVPFRIARLKDQVDFSPW
jgi:hypothetical protein